VPTPMTWPAGATFDPAFLDGCGSTTPALADERICVRELARPGVGALANPDLARAKPRNPAMGLWAGPGKIPAAPAYRRSPGSRCRSNKPLGLIRISQAQIEGCDDGRGPTREPGGLVSRGDA